MRRRRQVILLSVVASVAFTLPGGCTRTATAPAQLQATSQSNNSGIEIEAVSLLGKSLSPPELPSDVRAKRVDQLYAAQGEYDRDPHSEAAIIWVGRRLAYLGRYREAIDVFSNGLAIHPESYKLLRHRGHRLITLRKLDLAVADLERAAALIEGVPDEVEPDGQPNERNVPTSTSHTNIFYHLGLARYLTGDYGRAEQAYRRCMEFSQNDDMRVATAYWLYLTVRRLERDDDANAVLDGISADMDVIENTSYHRLLLVFTGELLADEISATSKGEPGVDDATIGYGLGMHYLFHGENTAAIQQFEHVIDNSNWAGFGHIAAEVELTRRSN